MCCKWPPKHKFKRCSDLIRQNRTSLSSSSSSATRKKSLNLALGQTNMDASIRGGGFVSNSCFNGATSSEQQSVTMAEIIDPDVKGTLKSYAKLPSIKRVVFTSSMAAVMFNGKPLLPGAVVDETWFSHINFYEQTKAWYKLSKTLAEKTASEFSKQSKINAGPWNSFRQPTINAIIEPHFNLVNGSQTYPNRSFKFVDVRDVASAHVLSILSQKERILLLSLYV